jgi:hypothetical protein
MISRERQALKPSGNACDGFTLPKRVHIRSAGPVIMHPPSRLVLFQLRRGSISR